jgi:hypothetical protein
MIADLILAYRAIKTQKQKDASLKRFVGKNPDYAVIKALILEARIDVVATITFPNGTKLDLKKADPTDKLLALMDPERAGAY